MLKQWAIAAGATIWLAAAGQAQSPQDIVGTYCLIGVREVGSCFRFAPNQTFEYYLSYGAYDEVSEGRWRLEGADVVLDGPAYDRKPRFVFKGRRAARGDAFEIIVETAGGRGIAGVDVRVRCDGNSHDGYTQTYGYQMQCAGEPSDIALGIRMVGLALQAVTFRGEGGAGKALVFALDPGDLGKKAMLGVRLRHDGARALSMTYRSEAVRDLDGRQFVYRKD